MHDIIHVWQVRWFAFLNIYGVEGQCTKFSWCFWGHGCWALCDCHYIADPRDGSDKDDWANSEIFPHHWQNLLLKCKAYIRKWKSAMPICTTFLWINLSKYQVQLPNIGPRNYAMKVQSSWILCGMWPVITQNWSYVWSVWSYVGLEISLGKVVWFVSCCYGWWLWLWINVFNKNIKGIKEQHQVKLVYWWCRLY